MLVTGGARGITAEVAVALARSSGCRLELVGRSALPEGDEEPALAAAADRGELRRALIATGMREPRAIEAECDRLLAEREVRATMSALAEVGAAVRYHRVDVTDAAALAGVVRSAYEAHGRLDGVVHGAGVLDDHVIADKSPESFARVYATKVEAARILLAALADAADDGRPPPAFVAFFGSIAGVCGNRGQVDYAAANDALDALAAAHAARPPGSSPSTGAPGPPARAWCRPSWPECSRTAAWASSRCPTASPPCWTRSPRPTRPTRWWWPGARTS